ncbi:MAG: hypothetical protein ABF820_10005 [Sporolactobacillus sp.]
MASKAIDPIKENYADWIKDSNTEFLPVYNEGIQDGVISKNISYANWITSMNYGQMPEGNKIFTVKSIISGPGDSYDVRAGDILLTNNTDPGILGHVGIATSSSYILDMPGKTNFPQASPDNNRHITVSKWIANYARDGKYVKVFRINNSSLANEVSTYAYHNFYSEGNSGDKNVHITYEITPNLWSKSPSYCSKLVYQAYYYGSGSENVVVHEDGILSPYTLVSYDGPHPVFLPHFGLHFVVQY